MSTARALARQAKDRVLRGKWRALWLAHHARLVETPRRWLGREILCRGHRVRYYVPRGSTHGLFLRHRSHDIEIVDEIFGSRLYELPPPVRNAVDRFERPLRVLDLGGHVGAFGAWMLTFSPDATVLTLEPDPQSHALLDKAARRSGVAWRVLQAAAAPETGYARFTALGQPDSHLSQHVGEERGVEVVTLDVLPLLGQADLAKIDIEGGEWAIVNDSRWPDSAPDVLVLEYHPELCPADDYEAAAIDAVKRAGMDYVLIEDSPPGAGMLWAWRDSAAD